MGQGLTRRNGASRMPGDRARRVPYRGVSMYNVPAARSLPKGRCERWDPLDLPRRSYRKRAAPDGEPLSWGGQNRWLADAAVDTRTKVSRHESASSWTRGTACVSKGPFADRGSWSPIRAPRVSEALPPALESAAPDSSRDREPERVRPSEGILVEQSADTSSPLFLSEKLVGTRLPSSWVQVTSNAAIEP